MKVSCARLFARRGLLLLLVAAGLSCSAEEGSWVTRDKRWYTRGSWNWEVRDQVPYLFREFNGIDFGHAHLAETLLSTLEPENVERARLEVLDFIFSSPSVPPDEEQIAPNFVRMVWPVERAFNWAHNFHRQLYDLYASDSADKEELARKILADYLAAPEALTTHVLDLHGKLWSFPESKAFRTKFPMFNTQIWAYHWLQGATYDVQLSGDARAQRERFHRLVAWYHEYLLKPPVEWMMMPMLHEGSPEFAMKFPEAAAVFDNLHMLHDNVDDILCRPDLYPTVHAKRAAILKILEIYLHRNHREGSDRYQEYHGKDPMAGMKDGMAGDDGMKNKMKDRMKGMGPRPPSAREVLEKAGVKMLPMKSPEPKTGGAHQGHDR